ncbi:MAG: shikimate dehydrogenase [Clostridiales bacterium]|nr:shikimate dehydrogenase [Clostridiales bacterium]
MSGKSFRSELVGLFGCPVDGNATGAAMEAAFKELDLGYRYITTLVYPQDLEAAVQALKAFNMKGTHITMPHKVEVMKYLDHVSETASLMGAVNTVYLKDGETFGENTDGIGFIASLTGNNIDIRGKRIAVLGAGGAARAMSIELAKAGASHIMIVNRGKDRGQALVDLLNGKTSANAELVPWDETFSVPDDTDILVNATSVGMFPDTNLPDIDFSTLLPNMIVSDAIIQNPVQTRFLEEAGKRGCKTINGVSMLINGGAVSFKLWTGLDAPIDTMKDALLAVLS